MAAEPHNINHTFTAPIGVTMKGEVWACVEMPNSAEFFGTGKSVRVDAAVRTKLAKNVGDTVTVRLTRRLV